MEREKKMAEAHQDLISKQGNNRVLPTICTGTRVWVQNQLTNKWDKSGTITEALDHHRQYTVKLDGSGRLSRRNRKHLKIISKQPVTNLVPNEADTPADQREPRPRRNRRCPDRLVL